jgi:hypothetical protein
MESYQFYPPQLRSTHMDYQVLRAGAPDCNHELLEVDWCDRIQVQDGIVFVTFSCKHCGRQLRQSLDEVVPPASWKGGHPPQRTPRILDSTLVVA